ncbi:hypothetical protein F5882DRAFT_471320 [Hyaloscypha sp. PMI_1271]|nr:hypothetical protein F5882DRAFT_471320 [Hyaloscypha sp. PMI_1271]
MRLYEYTELHPKDFARLGLYHLKELREQLQEEYRPPWTNKDDDFERLMARIEPPAIEPPAIEALVIEPPVIEALAIEAPQTEALPIEASPVDTILVETDEPSVEDPFTSTIDYCFAGSSIPESLSTTTLTLPLFSIPAIELRHSHSPQRTSGSLQRTNRITPTYTSERARVG